MEQFAASFITNNAVWLIVAFFGIMSTIFGYLLIKGIHNYRSKKR